jgi:hypothetical protein
MMGPIRATLSRRVQSGLCTEYDVERAAAQMRTSGARGGADRAPDRARNGRVNVVLR